MSVYRSKASKVSVGVNGTKLWTYTETKVNKDPSGKVTGGETTLYYSSSPFEGYVPAAVTTDGGNTWNYIKKTDGTPILGADAQRSLETGSLKTETQKNIIDSTTGLSVLVESEPTLKPEEVGQVAASAKNQATTDPNAQNPTPASGTDPESTAQTSTQPEPDATPAPDAAIASKPASSGNNSPVKSGKPAYYPLDIENNKNQDRIKFTAVEIQDKGGIGGELTYKPVTNSGPVYLSIQSPISDQNSVDWGPGTMGPIEKAMFNQAYKALSNNGGAFKAATDALGGLTNEIYKELQDLGAVGNAAMAAMAAGNINLFTRATSLALNPNLELLFNAPQLRPFAFSFLLTARSEGKEVEMIKKIIKYFKYHMAVRNVKGNLFLKTPHVFFIDYQYGTDETHKSINLIAPEKLATKACALTNFSVDYTPLGTYMTYRDPDKTMVAYRLNMQFMEITPVYQGDYDEGIGLDHPIGY